MNKIGVKYLRAIGLVFVHLVLSSNESKAQNNKEIPPSDTVLLKKGDFLYRNDSFQVMEKDTLLFLENGEYTVDKKNFRKTRQLYDSLGAIMDKNWITKEVYSMLFSSVARSAIDEGRQEYFNSVRAFQEYEGAQINSIFLTNVAVLEGSVDDTLLVSTSHIGQLANDLHIDTKKWVIRQYLLFKEGEVVRPYVLSDNERIIRSLDFIEDARIVLNRISEEEVNVYVITKDRFSLGAGGAVEGLNDVRVELFDKNILGIGNELRVGVIYNTTYDKSFGYAFTWNYNNIGGSFVDASLQYEHTSPREFFRQVISKRFLSPEIKYGGELDVGWRRDILNDYEIDTLYEQPYQLRYFDAWLGRSILLNTRDKRTNLIFTARYARNNYLTRPEVRADTNVFFHDNTLFLGSISLKKLNYFKSHKILGFGIVEDIPFGYIGRILVGKSLSEFFDRPYYGVQLSGGTYFENVGYVWLDTKLGSFWKENELNELLLNFNVVYYTPLYEFGNYEGRTIIHFAHNSGINDQDDRGLNFYRRVRDFDDRPVRGLGSFVLGVESIFFTPWYLYGFKFAPYAFADVGVLSDKGFKFDNLRTYTSFGLGIRIRNESLVFNTISMRISFVPVQLMNFGHIILNGSAGQPTLFNDGFDDKPAFNMLEVN